MLTIHVISGRIKTGDGKARYNFSSAVIIPIFLQPLKVYKANIMPLFTCTEVWFLQPTS